MNSTPARAAAAGGPGSAACTPDRHRRSQGPARNPKRAKRTLPNIRNSADRERGLVWQAILVTMSEPPGHGDDDPVAQFSDPEFRHGYPEYPAGAFPPAPAGPPAPAWRIPAPRRSSRRRLLAMLITVILLAMVAGLAAGLVASLAHLKHGPVAGGTRPSWQA